ncbi:MAG: hypothetical protein K8T25_11895, partial [Planctomycetia bacterium]|nr:hypothetical protein [Planctomycetia bacterium]
AETGSYVITLFISFVFITVLALAAYRVASAGSRGWYFLGRESLSTLAKAWNTLVAAAVVTTGIVVLANIYFDSADYRAGRTLARAEAAQAEGHVAEAGNLYREVASGSTSHAPIAEAKFKALVELVTKQRTLTDATAIYEQGVQWNRQQRGKSTPAELTAGALSIVNRSGKQDPENALKLLDIVSPIAPSRRGSSCWSSLWPSSRAMSITSCACR